MIGNSLKRRGMRRIANASASLILILSLAMTLSCSDDVEIPKANVKQKLCVRIECDERYYAEAVNAPLAIGIWVNQSLCSKETKTTRDNYDVLYTEGPINVMVDGVYRTQFLSDYMEDGDGEESSTLVEYLRDRRKRFGDAYMQCNKVYNDTFVVTCDLFIGKYYSYLDVNRGGWKYPEVPDDRLADTSKSKIIFGEATGNDGFMGTKPVGVIFLQTIMDFVSESQVFLEDKGFGTNWDNFEMTDVITKMVSHELAHELGILDNDLLGQACHDIKDANCVCRCLMNCPSTQTIRYASDKTELDKYLDNAWGQKICKDCYEKEKTHLYPYEEIIPWKKRW
jgi:hypothetical protein